MISDFDTESDLDELYQQVILDHSRHPRNCRTIDDADAKAEGYNPLCGDRVTIYLKRSGETVDDVAFSGTGCAICTASASMMTQILRGKSLEEVQQMFQAFQRMLTARYDEKTANEILGKLAVFAGVKKYPVRVKCATLPWHTVKAALEHKDEPVTTE